MLGFIEENIELVTIFVSALPALVALYSLLTRKVQEQKLTNYKKFHSIMQTLSNQDGKTGLDQQLAIIFEMRNLPQYRPVIVRILKGSSTRWQSELEKNAEEVDKYRQLIEEARNTINYIEKPHIERFFVNVRGKIWKYIDIS